MLNRTAIIKKLVLLVCLFLGLPTVVVRAETPDEWVMLGHRIHGGFGTYIALGIRIGQDAMQRLRAKPRDLDVTYQDGPKAPCSCVADGIMIATVATPGQDSLRILPTKSDPKTLGIVVIKHKKTGQLVRYTLPDKARSLLDTWNQDKIERHRYDSVMNAPPDSLFRVEMLPSP